MSMELPFKIPDMVESTANLKEPHGIEPWVGLHIHVYTHTFIHRERERDRDRDRERERERSPGLSPVAHTAHPHGGIYLRPFGTSRSGIAIGIKTVIRV